MLAFLLLLFALFLGLVAPSYLWRLTPPRARPALYRSSRSWWFGGALAAALLPVARRTR